MLKLDFSNVEELIFHNSQLQYILPPHLGNYFDTWALAKRVPALKQVGRQAMYDLLNNLDEDSLLRLEEFFGERIVLEKLHYSVVRNLKIPLDDVHACQALCSMVGDHYFGMHRDDQFLYITFWR